MKIMPDWLISALSDGATPPSTSMTRLLAFGTVVSTIWIPALGHLVVCLVKGLPIITMEYVAFVTAGAGATLTLFAFNKRAEGPP